jgi:hypothetical protein
VDAEGSAELFEALVGAIVADDAPAAVELLKQHPELATHASREGATRAEAVPHFIPEFACYVYEGATALHVAAAGHRTAMVTALLAAGADAHARDRRGSEPLHYAASGGRGLAHWSPKAQVATIRLLVAAGADVSAMNKDGAAPLHRAIRSRCADAVAALIECGADPRGPNRRGTTPLQLATLTTGASGSGSPAAHAEQARILALLEPLVSPQAGAASATFPPPRAL